MPPSEVSDQQLEDFLRSFAIGDFAVTTDEHHLAFSTNLGGQYDIWAMDLPVTYPHLLARTGQPATGLRFDPNGLYLLSASDRDGDESLQMTVTPSTGGPPRALQPTPGKRHFPAFISQDGRRIYYASNKENAQYLNGYCVDLDAGTERRLYEGAGALTALVDVAPDESSFVTCQVVSNTEQTFYLTKGDETSPLAHGAQPYHGADLSYVSADQIALTLDLAAEHRYLASYDISTGHLAKVLELPHADLGAIAVDRSRGVIWTVATVGVEDQLYQVELDTGKSCPVDLPVALVDTLRVTDSGALYILGRSETEPANIWRRDPSSANWVRLTDHRVMGVARSDLVPAQTLHFASFDGLEMEGLWFAAHPDRANGYTIIWPHGGPQAAERRSFRPLFQYALLRGYSIWAPNFRGSTGYGKPFAKLVEGDWGDGPRKDMVASVEWLVSTGRSDRDKLFLVGGSYGGYMTLLLHGRHGEMFQAYVDVFGPSDLLTFVESVPEFWKPLMKQWLGDPVADRERLVADSPITYLDGMNRPMLVIQGANDPRVVRAESEQIVAALRERGVTVEYLVFDDEGHGFTKKENEITAYTRLIDFLDAQRT
ncbi:MAG: S9 family peptidase [Sulfobacillus sp.]